MRQSQETTHGESIGSAGRGGGGAKGADIKKGPGFKITKQTTNHRWAERE